MKIVFFGTPEFAVASLDRLINDRHDIAAVVTMPDKIAGRAHKLIQSDVKKYALEKGLKILQPEKLRDPGFIEELRALNADLFVVIAFRMLPEIVWAMPPKGTFNLHGSLLPKYRGAAPINRAIMNGETETGVTTFFLTHEIDTGDIIEARSITIGPDENAGSVHDRLMELGADMVTNTVRMLESGRLVPKPQPQGEFIPAPKIFREDCIIKWDRKATDIHNLVRGLSPYPTACSTLVEKSGRPLDVKIYATKITDIPTDGLNPGETVVSDRRLLTATADNMIEILTLQPAGKKTMEARDFLLGYHPDHFIC